MTEAEQERADSLKLLMQAAYERGRADERADVVAWLRDLALSEGSSTPASELPLLRAVFWGLLHPFKLGVAAGKLAVLTRSSNAIERREHMKGPDK